MSAQPAAGADAPPLPDARSLQRYERLRGILGGTTPITLHLEFLYSHNRADLQARAPARGACMHPSQGCMQTCAPGQTTCSTAPCCTASSAAPHGMRPALAQRRRACRMQGVSAAGGACRA